MALGFYFARRKMFDPQHKVVMTLVVILNWVLIGAVMINSYSLAVAPNLPDSLSDSFNLIPTIHGITGLVAQLMATYLVLLMWTENTPFEKIVIFRIKHIKTPMRVTLSLWLITVIMGFGVYAVWYGGESNASGDTPAPDTTEEAIQSDAPALDSTVIPDSDPSIPDAIVEPPDSNAPPPDTTEAVDG
ncbi:MAG: hypothetical protein ACFE0Q_04695 [Anaerolineae bacterium]